MTGLTRGQALELGDLNGDFHNDHADFVLFKSAFEAANGDGSFAAMLAQVPEPSSNFLAIFGYFSLALRVGRARRS